MTNGRIAGAEDAEHLATLTRRYARYSLEAAGLGHVLGGVLAVVTYFVGAIATPESGGGRMALAAAPLIWIVGKEGLRVRYYQGLGRVEQLWSDADRRWHLGFTAFTVAVSAFVLTTLVANAWPDLTALATRETIGYAAFVAAMPLLVWFFMRTPLEYVVGVFLVAQAAVLVGGGNYALGAQLQAPVAAVVLIVLGTRQHLQYLALRRELVNRGVGQ